MRKDLGNIYREIELPLAPMLYRMEQGGGFAVSILKCAGMICPITLGEALGPAHGNKIYKLACREFQY